MTPIALTIAGSDPSGGAGIQADLKTFAALGVYGASVITAVTAQNTAGVRLVETLPASIVEAQLDAVLSDLNVAAVKIGMPGAPPAIEAIARRVERWSRGPVVFDPVMTATSGDELTGRDALDVLKQRLVPIADLMTPNLTEAAALLGVDPARGADEMGQHAEALRALGARAALVTGGDADGSEAVDMLCDGAGVCAFSAPRIDSRNTHGTGCTLSSAIAAHLAHGTDLREAIRAAKVYVSEAIGAADQLAVGAGPGPLNHFPALWKG